jgi:hypothetical protein
MATQASTAASALMVAAGVACLVRAAAQPSPTAPRAPARGALRPGACRPAPGPGGAPCGPAHAAAERCPARRRPRAAPRMHCALCTRALRLVPGASPRAHAGPLASLPPPPPSRPAQKGLDNATMNQDLLGSARLLADQLGISLVRAARRRPGQRGRGSPSAAARGCPAPRQPPERGDRQPCSRGRRVSSRARTWQPGAPGPEPPSLP